jgi:ferredoxin, 2Fe-2S
MPKITFIQLDGTATTVEAELGRSLMDSAKASMVPGIVADCGGCCSCATCHIYVAQQWIPKLPSPTSAESEMLEGAIEVNTSSRLSCQLTVTEDLEGLVVHVPATQY